MSIPKNLLREYPSLSDWCILSAYRGSIAHNMYIPNSDPDSIDDKDAIAICVPPLDYYIGLKNFGSRGTKEIKYREWDIVVYELKKAINLLSKGNPNILSMLWLEPNHYLKITETGQLLLDSRDLFVGKHVYHSFTGYAYSQLHRMTSGKFEGYMGEKRRTLVEKFGFDTKNAAHLIRLLRMSIEFLTEGRLHVFRQDAKELLAIKRGEWSLERVKKEAEELFKLSREAYVNSDLPNEVDKADINNLCTNLIYRILIKR